MEYVVFDSFDGETKTYWTFLIPMMIVYEINVIPGGVITTKLERYQGVKNLKFFDSLEEAYKEVEKRRNEGNSKEK